MTELGDALKVLLAKVGDLIDIFDLSFFVSGAACLGALTAWNHFGGFFAIGLSEGYQVFAVGLGCYVLGLLCFACGRAARSRPRGFYQAFAAAVERHGLSA